MAIKKYKPTSPGRRFATYLQHEAVTKTEPEKALTEGLKKSGGRNSYGRVTSRHRGGGAKRRYRKIDFKRRKDGVPAKVAAIEYDPNRSAHIALLHYADGEKRYILAPGRINVGDTDLVGSRRGHRARLLPAAPEHPDRYHGAQRGADPRPRRPARPLRRHVDPAGRQGGPLRDAAAALGRDAHGAHGLPRHDRRARQRRARARRAGQGRPLAPQGRAPADARRGHEPGGPPARRRRGAPHAGRPPATPWGVPTLGYRTRKKKKTSDRYIVRGRRRGKKGRR